MVLLFSCQEQNQKRLERWMKETNIKLTQVNGQRKYGGPPEVWDGPPPGAHCEVFISQIPRDVYEDLLIPLFGFVGPLWEFRLMMNFSGENRGFAFAKYGSPALAATAIRLLHGHMLESGVSLKVQLSIEKRHLCLGGLPSSTRREELMQ
ncbi:dead end protein 1-like, partial [Diretmus argenteus]